MISTLIELEFIIDLYPPANLTVVIVVVAEEVSSEEKCHNSLVSS